MRYLPSILWTVICARGLWTWRHNAIEMTKNLTVLDEEDKDAVLLARADWLKDNVRAFAFLNGEILGLSSFLFVRDEKFQLILKLNWLSWAWVQRLFNDYTLTVLIGTFFLFMLNGEIHRYVHDKVHGRR